MFRYKMKLKGGRVIKTNMPPREINDKDSVEWVKMRVFLFFWVKVNFRGNK